MSSQENASERSVDFYIKHKISPVTKDISDLRSHLDSRESLFRQLGIVPSFLTGKSVIEFGPGGGHNSIYTLQLAPSRYVLVDGNATGLETVRDLFEQYQPAEANYELAESFIEDFRSDVLFDFVICENVIPLQQNDPRHVLTCVSNHVKPGGVLVVTCMDNVSFLADVLGQLAGELLVTPELSIPEQLDIMRPFFERRLHALKGATTLVDDFMLDSIVQHYPRDGKMLSIADTIQTLDSRFEVHASSPRFLTDWRWHKSLNATNRDLNARAIEQYRRNIHNLLDYRFVLDEMEGVDSDRMITACDYVFEATKKFRRGRDPKQLLLIRKNLEIISAIIADVAGDTAAALQDFISGIDAFLDSQPLPPMDAFVPFFGRGTQYLSFIRRPDDS